jgi:hypothetical protein
MTSWAENSHVEDYQSNGWSMNMPSNESQKVLTISGNVVQQNSKHKLEQLLKVK